LTTRYQEMQAALRERGLRMTPQRLAIVRVVAEDPSHPTVDRVFEAVRKTFPTTSRATVYKTFETLKEIGQLIELEFSDRGNRYDAMRVTTHAHAVCERCGRIDDVELGEASDLRAGAAKRSNFRITSERVDFYGLCPDCQSATA